MSPPSDFRPILIFSSTSSTFSLNTLSPHYNHNKKRKGMQGPLLFCISQPREVRRGIAHSSTAGDRDKKPRSSLRFQYVREVTDYPQSCEESVFRCAFSGGFPQCFANASGRKASIKNGPLRHR